MTRSSIGAAAHPHSHVWSWRRPLQTVDKIDQHRRRFFGAAAMAVAATQLGKVAPAAAQPVQTTLPAIRPG